VNTFSKVLYSETLYRKYPRGMAFENPLYRKNTRAMSSYRKYTMAND
jgi:hypothetical protein